MPKLHFNREYKLKPSELSRVVTAGILLLASYGSMSADAAQLVAPASYTEYFVDAVQNGTGESKYISDASSATYFEYYALYNNSFALGNLTITNSPIAAVAASSHVYNIGAEPTSKADGTLNYQVEFVGRPGFVPVEVSANGYTSVSGSNSYLVAPGDNYALISFSVKGTNVSISKAMTNELMGGDTSGTLLRYGSQQMFTANTIYNVSIRASTSGQIFNNDVGLYSVEGAYIDPSFVIDPSFASSYQLEISPGIGNEISSVPLPATAPMFGACLLGLGVAGFGRKRRRRTATRASGS